MEAPLQGPPNRVLLLFSIILTIPHIVLFLDSIFPAAVCKNYAFLDPARSRILLCLGSFYSAAISTWSLSAKYKDFFSYHPSPPKQNGIPNKISTSSTMASEKSRYLCVLTMTLLSELTLAMDLSWAWYQDVIYTWSLWSLPLVTEIGAFYKLMSMMMFPMCVLWLTMLWTLGNLIPFMAFGNLMSVGLEAGVEQVVRWDRSSRRLENDKKDQ